MRKLFSLLLLVLAFGTVGCADLFPPLAHLNITNNCAGQWFFVTAGNGDSLGRLNTGGLLNVGLKGAPDYDNHYLFHILRYRNADNEPTGSISREFELPPNNNGFTGPSRDQVWDVKYGECYN